MTFSSAACRSTRSSLFATSPWLTDLLPSRMRTFVLASYPGSVTLKSKSWSRTAGPGASSTPPDVIPFTTGSPKVPPGTYWHPASPRWVAIEDRHRIVGRVSDESHEGWLGFARDHGISLANLVDAIGIELAGQEGRRPSEPWRRIVARARRIGDEHRRRS